MSLCHWTFPVALATTKLREGTKSPDERQNINKYRLTFCMCTLYFCSALDSHVPPTDYIHGATRKLPAVILYR